MENMQIWNNLKTPPNAALKKIKGGRLSGMTDISPQWRYQALTEQFGPCGIGWKYEIVNQWLEQGTEGQIVAFAAVNLYIKVDGEWSDCIPGTGGSMFVAKEKAGLRTSDEAYKMATTDALSVACKIIGVGADVYLGNMDGSKYAKPPQTKQSGAPPLQKAPPAEKGPAEEKISIDQAIFIKDLCDKIKLSPAQLQKMLHWDKLTQPAEKIEELCECDFDLVANFLAQKSMQD